MSLVSIPDFLTEWQKYGWSKDQSLGVVGAVLGEANKVKKDGVIYLDSGSVEKAPRFKDVGFGLFQYTSPDRKNAFNDLFGKPIQNSTWQDQIAFANHELNTTYKKAGDALKKSDSTYSALQAFVKKFEIPHNADKQVDIRYNLLNKVLGASNLYANTYGYLDNAKDLFIGVNKTSANIAKQTADKIYEPITSGVNRVLVGSLGLLLLTVGLIKLKG